MDTVTFTYNISDMITGIIDRLEHMMLREQNMGTQIEALTQNVQTLTTTVASLANTVTLVAAMNQTNIVEMAQAIGQMPTGTGQMASTSSDKIFIAKPTPQRQRFWR